MTATPREVVLRLIDGVCEDRWAELPDLYAERTDVRHPMAPDGTPVLRTRDDLRAHFTPPTDPGAVLPPRTAVDVVVHETSDPEVVIVEFSYAFTRPDREVVSVPCVFVVRVRDGEIVESRDYTDHARAEYARR